MPLEITREDWNTDQGKTQRTDGSPGPAALLARGASAVTSVREPVAATPDEQARKVKECPGYYHKCQVLLATFEHPTRTVVDTA